MLGALMVSFACEHDAKDFGSLTIKSAEAGNYEVYKVTESSGNEWEYSSETNGTFNEKLSLHSGRYLIFADCSHVPLTINRRGNIEIEARQIKFKHISVPANNDKFVIQCDRGPVKGFKQKIVNRFSLNVLPVAVDMLVGVLPMKLDLQKAHNEGIQPTALEFELASIKVDATTPATSYYVSAKDALIPIAEEQQSGNRLYLLPGSYNLELNGTKQEYLLKEKDDVVVTPAVLRINTPVEVNLEAYERVARRPVEVATKGNNLFAINADQPTLPVNLKLFIHDSLNGSDLVLESGKKTVMDLRAVKLIKDCIDSQMTCRGKRAVYLFKEGESYPFQKSTLDVPIFYHVESPVVASLDNSGSIKFKLPNKSYVEIGVGELDIKSTIKTDVGLKTDFIRIVPKSPGYEGASFDIDTSLIHRLALMEGSYELLHYYSGVKKSAESRRQALAFVIKKGQTVEIPLTVYRLKN